MEKRKMSKRKEHHRKTFKGEIRDLGKIQNVAG